MFEGRNKRRVQYLRIGRGTGLGRGFRVRELEGRPATAPFLGGFAFIGEGVGCIVERIPGVTFDPFPTDCGSARKFVEEMFGERDHFPVAFWSEFSGHHTVSPLAVIVEGDGAWRGWDLKEK